VKFVIAGGSGHLGTLLARAREAMGDEVVVLSRTARTVSAGAGSDGVSSVGATSVGAARRVVAWDAKNVGPWAAELDGADVVVNLAGRSVNCRYTPRNRREIVDSRVDSTTAVGAAIASAQAPPKLWLQASTATIYAHRYDAANDEATGIIGGTEPGVPETWRFSIDVVRAWEHALDDAPTPQTRKVKLRAAIVMSPGAGGPFEILLRLVRLGLGGPSGDGRQYVSWIHGTDFARAIDWIVHDESLTGAVNLAAPNPLPNAAFMRDLRAAAHMPIGLPSPCPMLELGALVLGTETELVLKSRRVAPGKLLASGFTFNFSIWEAAARDLCAVAEL
jgi:uncharacterized protein (TIGR01777 family)